MWTITGGVNFFDCAEGYGYAGAAERVLGEALQIGLQKGTWDRMDLVRRNGRF